jgi:hypothetical protein
MFPGKSGIGTATDAEVNNRKKANWCGFHLFTIEFLICYVPQNNILNINM